MEIAKWAIQFKMWAIQFKMRVFAFQKRVFDFQIVRSTFRNVLLDINKCVFQISKMCVIHVKSVSQNSKIENLQLNYVCSKYQKCVLYMSTVCLIIPKLKICNSILCIQTWKSMFHSSIMQICCFNVCMCFFNIVCSYFKFACFALQNHCFLHFIYPD